MAEHHALIGVHCESIAPAVTAHLRSYNTLSEVTAGQPHNVGKLAAFSNSDFLSARYPYPNGVEYVFEDPSIAYGRQGVKKTLAVLRMLVSNTGSDNQKKQANIEKLYEALNDHRSIGDTLTSSEQSSVVELLEKLLTDVDPGVRQGAARVLGRLATMLQGRQALCQSGCAATLAGMLEDLESADVRLEAGRTLKTLVCSPDGRVEVAEKVADGAVIFTMVRALLAISTKNSSLATPGLEEVLLESLASVLVSDKAISVALEKDMMPFLVHTLKKRRKSMATMQALISICTHPDGKLAAIENGALGALCGLLASEKAIERQLAARAVLIICVEEQGETPNPSSSCVT
jgi:hypothetical protein